MPEIQPHAAQLPYFLAFDLGTSSLRGLIFDQAGRMVSGYGATQTFELHTTPDGGVESDAEIIFQGFCGVMSTILQQLGDETRHVAGIGVDTYVGNILGISADGQPATPVYTWADTRNAQAAERLKRTLDEQKFHTRTGTVFHTSYLPARFLWLQERYPELLRKSRYWLSIGEYIILRLFGKRLVSYSIASWSGLLNRQELIWDPELLQHLPVTADQLSPLVDIDRPVRGLLPEFARKWPALAQVPWLLPVGDGVTSNLGSGCRGPQDFTLNVGTSGAMRVIWPGEAPPIPLGLWSYRVDRQRHLIGGALSNGGNLYAWARQTLQLPPEEVLEQELAQMAPDSHGLTILPFLAGERSPGYASGARATISGINLHTRPVDMVRAGLEAIAYRFALIYHLLIETVTSSQPLATEAPGTSARPSTIDGAAVRIIASGGALLNSPTWMQIMADVLGRPVIASAEAEATCRGTALLVKDILAKWDGAATGGALDAPDAVVGRTFMPNPAHRVVYERGMERQKALYRELIKPPAPV
ncbi:MAG: carbohydrate kinase [Chloroflexi bacterium]|nr:carbohydrate kinase [Chloroflexota bacterium]